MQTNILWTGREYYSLENCLVTKSATGLEIDSAIIGSYDNEPYRVEYLITTNARWETLAVELKIQLHNKRQMLRFKTTGAGIWTNDGKSVGLLAGCIDVDISLTPLTNSLPINRLKLRVGETREINVAYFDLLQLEVRPARQKYSRHSELTYKFENVPNDFEAVIKVDEEGFVVDYPDLFERIGKYPSNHPK